MPLPSSPNSISMNQVNIELGRSGTAQISLNESAVRTLAGAASGVISMDNLRGKSASRTVEYLVVAGGAGGWGGGGGAGGMRTGSVALGSGTYTVTVGSGGAALTNGSDSTFYNITSTGGGTSGSGSGSGITVGADGGSGGGGAEDAGYETRGGYGIPGQGNNGGHALRCCPAYWGGGGGAGAAGSGQYGGNGLESSITGTAIYYAGGGGGQAYATSFGTGGLGGGGNAGAYDPQDGGINLGGGGGGGRYVPGRPGGSGIVVVRFSNSLPQASSTTGSPTYINSGGYHIYKFTGSGSITW